MRRLPTIIIAAAMTMPTAIHAQQSCADRSVVTQRLMSSYGEKFVGGGYRNETSIFEVWQSEDTGTWTILMTMPNGQACVMAAGTHWRGALPETPAGIPG